MPTFDVTTWIPLLTEMRAALATGNSLPPDLTPLKIGLRGLPGGPLAGPTSLLRSVASGREGAKTARVLAALDSFLEVSHETLAHLLAQPRPPNVRLSYFAPQLVSQKGKFDDAGFALFPDGTKVDPLLDHQPTLESFAFLEKAVSRGPVMSLDSLGLRVYAPPSLSLQSPADLYAYLLKGVDTYLIDRLLYLVPEKPPDEAAKNLALAKDLWNVTPVQALTLADGPGPSTGRISNIPHSWLDRKNLGSLDLVRVSEQVARRWIHDQDIPATDSFRDLPAARRWFQDHSGLTHWSDLRRLEGYHNALWGHVTSGGLKKTERDAIIDQVFGLLGEIHQRGEILRAYRAAVAEDHALLLLVEGEIRTSDGRMASDALLGYLKVEERIFRVVTAFEITVSSDAADTAVEQHRQTLGERFPGLGMILLAESGEWGRVRVETDGAERRVMIGGADLRQKAEEIVEEMLGYLAIRRGTAQSAPEEERRKAKNAAGATAAGHFVSKVTAGLWEQVEQKRAKTGTTDLDELRLQLEGRERLYPGPLGHRFRAYRRALVNVSGELNESGERLSMKKLAGEVGIAHSTVTDDQREIIEWLNKLESPVLPDPEAERSMISQVSGVVQSIRKRLLEEKWPTARDFEAAVEEESRGATDPKVQTMLKGYLGALRNVSQDLNQGRRSARGMLSRVLGISSPTLKTYQDEIAVRLMELGFPTHPDPKEKMAEASRAIHITRTILARLVAKSWSSAAAWETAIQAEIDQNSEDRGVQKRLRAFLATLRNVSKDLNPGERRPRNGLARDLGVSPNTVAADQMAISQRLTGLKLPAHPDPEEKKSKARRTGSVTQKIFDSHLAEPWASAEEWVGELEAEIDRASDPEVKKRIRAFLAALRNVSQELNLGERLSASKLAGRVGVTRPTTRRDQATIVAHLETLELPTHPDPGANAGKSIKSGKAVQPILAQWLGQRWSSAREWAAAVEEAIRTETDPEIQNRLRAFQASLHDVSPELNPTATRRSGEALAREVGTSSTTVRSDQEAIAERLKSLGLPVIE